MGHECDFEINCKQKPRTWWITGLKTRCLIYLPARVLCLIQRGWIGVMIGDDAKFKQFYRLLFCPIDRVQWDDCSLVNGLFWEIAGVPFEFIFKVRFFILTYDADIGGLYWNPWIGGNVLGPLNSILGKLWQQIAPIWPLFLVQGRSFDHIFFFSRFQFRAWVYLARIHRLNMWYRLRFDTGKIFYLFPNVTIAG